MAAALLITFRETLEAALVVGIALSYLKKTNQLAYKKFVWAGVVAGIALSILGAYIFEAFAGGFTGSNEALFEGIVMLVGAALLTTMILWMMKEKGKKLKAKMAAHIDAAKKWELFGLVFVAVLREGIETVIFLYAARAAVEQGILSGSIIGIATAAVLGYLLYKGSLKLPLKKFFTVSSILLILFAAGLVAHGVHELQEAGVVPIVAEHIWDINPEVAEEGVYPALHEKGSVGSIFKGLFGYNGNPNLLEVLAYLVYLGGIGYTYKRFASK